MDVEEAIRIVRDKSSGRTRWEGQEPYLDEVLVEEVLRLRGALRYAEGYLEDLRKKVQIPARVSTFCGKCGMDMIHIMDKDSVSCTYCGDKRER